MAVRIAPARPVAPGEQAADDEEDAAGARSRPRRRFRVDPLIALFGAVLLLIGVVRPFVAEPFFVPTGSMAPTLVPGDHVLAWKLAYRLGEPRRGDLAVFSDPEGGEDALIKRVVGLGGDTVEVQDGVLHVNGVPRHEPYVDYAMVDSIYFGPVTVPSGHLFVMGDDRWNSRDSRDFGAVPEGDLAGKVVARIWPPDRLGSPEGTAALAKP